MSSDLKSSVTSDRSLHYYIAVPFVFDFRVLVSWKSQLIEMFIHVF